MKKLAIKLTTSIIGLILALFLLELSAKYLVPIFKISHGNLGLGIGNLDALEYTRGYIKDRELFWRLESFCTEYNSKGLRDKEFSTEKDSGTFRIICMGDSVTFGWPSKMEETYPKVLGELLNAYFPEKKFEVLNAGVPGYSSYQGLRWLETELIRYSPDLIIAYYGINDRAGSDKPDRKQRLLPEWAIQTANYLRRFHFYKLFNKIILRLKYPPGRPSFPFLRVSPEEFRKNLLSMERIVEKAGGKALFITKPAYYDPERKIVFTSSGHISPEDVLQFDIYSVFKKRQNQAHELFNDDCRPFNFHLTPKGQKILAEQIYNFLINSHIKILGDAIDSE